jgi:signal transduction histidine kinase
LALVIAGLAIYFFRENAREMREASQRVSFVNQVSHELKTPLTNIRMYAEMIDEELGEEDETLRRRLQIIVAESQRLSRLIGNVLTFSRKQRSTLTLHPEPGNIDSVLRDLTQNFEPSLRAKGIETTCFGNAGHTAVFDRDVLEQIVGNLLSNVEKYARSARGVEVRSTQEDETVTITVADDGPGIPQRDRARVFDPFYRVSNRLTDGVAGTGIGLSIARDLARLHGGDLLLQPSARGACFRLAIRALQHLDEERA